MSLFDPKRRYRELSSVLPLDNTTALVPHLIAAASPRGVLVRTLAIRIPH